MTDILSSNATGHFQSKGTEQLRNVMNISYLHIGDEAVISLSREQLKVFKSVSFGQYGKEISSRPEI